MLDECESVLTPPLCQLLLDLHVFLWYWQGKAMHMTGISLSITSGATEFKFDWPAFTVMRLSSRVV